MLPDASWPFAVLRVSPWTSPIRHTAFADAPSGLPVPTKGTIYRVRAPDFFHALVLLNLLFASGLWALMRPSGPASVVLVCVGVAWLIWNGPIEGATLISFSSRHGVTESDLLSLAAFWIAGASYERMRRRKARGPHSPNG